MTNPEILILDDQEHWVARHKQRFHDHGYDVIGTTSGEEAVRLVKSHSSIRFALLDEILLVSPRSKEKQRFQGKTVWRKIKEIRPEHQFHFAFVTDAPRILAQKKVATDGKALDRGSVFDNSGSTILDQMYDAVVAEEDRLRELTGVVALISKRMVDYDADKEYRRLLQAVDKVLRPTPAMQAQEPIVAVGYGLEEEQFKAIREFVREKQREAGGRKLLVHPTWIHLREFVAARFTDANIAEILSKAKERCVFLRSSDEPGMLYPITDIVKPGTRPFQVLEIIATKAEFQSGRQDDTSASLIGITDEEFDALLVSSSRTSASSNPGRTGKPGSARRSVRRDNEQVVDFSYDGEDDSTSGFQFKSKGKDKSYRRTTYGRLRQQLKSAGVRPRKAGKLLLVYSTPLCTPNFEIEAIIYLVATDG